MGQVGEGKLFGDPFDAKLEEPGNVVNDAEENSANDQAPRSRILRTTTAWKGMNNAMVTWFLVNLSPSIIISGTFSQGYYLATFLHLTFWSRWTHQYH